MASGTTFEQLGNLDRCLDAISKAYSNSELWVDSLIKSAKKQGRLPAGTTVLLHWWQNIKQVDINWEYWYCPKNEFIFRYEDYTGKAIYIHDSNRHMEVNREKTIGFPNDLLDKIDGLSVDEFSSFVEDTLSKYIGTDSTELKIIDK